MPLDMSAAAAEPDPIDVVASWIQQDPAQAMIELDRMLVEAGGLREMIPLAWPYVEGLSKQYIGNWHIDAICEHLTAVSEGQIRRLAIAMPPRHMKSLAVSVMWLAWDWIKNPWRQFLFASYAQPLAIRDSVKTRKLVSSPWYQARWGGTFGMSPDQNAKSRFENNKTGYRLSTSVNGQLTGEGGDIIVCLPGDEIVWTARGPVPIEQIVRERDPSLHAWAFDVDRGAVALKPIIGWHTNPGRPILRITLSDGRSFRCTADHRVWTRWGWVAAGQLQASDVLPGVTLPDSGDAAPVDTVLGRESVLAARTGNYGPNVIVGESRQMVHDASGAIGRVAQAIGNIPPCHAAPNPPNRVRLHAVRDSEVGSRISALRDPNHLRSGQLGAGAILIHREGAAPLDDAGHAPNPAQVGNLIELEAGDRSPFLVEVVGHVEHTFCLTVADWHTTIVGYAQTIVSNCDDAHNVRRAESKKIRDATVAWWDESLSTRLNDPKSGSYVLIQQRVHERDLMGHVLIQESVEPWTHLCLPAEFEPDYPQRWFRDPRKEAGELLWPERMGRKQIDGLKISLGPYAAAAQLQQRPVPRDGGIFKRTWFPRPYLKVAPADTRWVRAWDFAGTEKKLNKADPDWTAGAKVGWSASMARWIIADITRFREEPHEVERLVKHTAEADGVPVQIQLAQDPAQAGKHQAQNYLVLLSRFQAFAETVNGDKMTRALTWAGKAGLGLVLLMEGDWNEPFLQELTGFPNGAHDDQVDAVTSAFNRLVNSNDGMISYYENLLRARGIDPATIKTALQKVEEVAAAAKKEADRTAGGAPAPDPAPLKGPDAWGAALGMKLPPA
jgi:predicted phage terminase large subunit-like protein